MRRTIVCLTVSAALTFLAPLPAEAGTFGDPVTLSNPDRNATAPDIAVDGNGVAHAAWAESAANGNRVVRYAEHRPGHPWTAPISLSTDDRDASGLAIATDAAGDLAVAWASGTAVDDQSDVVVRRRTAAGAWGGPVVISTAGHSSGGPLVARLNNDRDLVVGWEGIEPVTHHYEQVVRVRLRGQPWGTAHSLAPGSRQPIGLQLVLDPAGTVTAAWTDIVGPPRDETTRVRAASKRAGQVWGASVKLSGDSVTDGDLALALRGGSTPWLAWRHQAGSTDGIWARHRTAAGWSPAVRVSKPGSFGATPAIDANTAGQLIVVWTAGSNPLRSRLLNSSGTWRPIALLPMGGTGRALLPQVEIARDGRAAALWQQGGDTFVAWFGPRANTWGGQQKAPGQLVNGPQLAMNPQADAAVIWRQLVDPARVQAWLGHG
jgi:hypothetical protein